MSSYFQVFDTGARPVIIFDSQMTIVYQNEKSKDLFGINLVGAKSDLTFGNHSEHIRSSVETCLSGKGPCEVSQVKISGRSFRALFNNATVGNNNFVVMALEDTNHLAQPGNSDLLLYEKALRALGRIARNPESRPITSTIKFLS